MPHFRGQYATQLAQRQFLDGNRFTQILKGDTDPYVGTLPPVFQQSGLPEPQVWQAMDHLAEFLRSLSYPDLDSFRCQLGGLPITVSKANSGGFGSVYQIRAGSQTFAMKLYFPLIPPPGLSEEEIQETLSNQGPFAEAASGLYLIRFNSAKFTRYHAGNPFAGWGLDQWCQRGDESAQLDKISWFLFWRGLSHEDLKPDNAFGNTLIDRGGLKSISVLRQISQGIGEGLKSIGEKGLQLLTVSQRLALIRHGLREPIQAIFEEPQDRLAFFNRMAAHPNTRMLAAQLIPTVDADYGEPDKEGGAQVRAFKTMFAYPECRKLCIEALDRIYIPGDQKRAVAQMILDTRDETLIGHFARHLGFWEYAEQAEKAWLLTELLKVPAACHGLAQHIMRFGHHIETCATQLLKRYPETAQEVLETIFEKPYNLGCFSDSFRRDALQIAKQRFPQQYQRYRYADPDLDVVAHFKARCPEFLLLDPANLVKRRKA